MIRHNRTTASRMVRGDLNGLEDVEKAVISNARRGGYVAAYGNNAYVRAGCVSWAGRMSRRPDGFETLQMVGIRELKAAGIEQKI